MHFRSLYTVTLCLLWCLATVLPSVAQEPTLLTLDEALRLADQSDSTYSKQLLSQQIAGRDVALAKAALKPNIEGQVGTLYTTPSLAPTSPKQPSFLGANAIWEHKALLVLQGQIDISGLAHANIQKAREMLKAGAADSRVAKLDLVKIVSQAYLDATFATAKRETSAELLATAQRFRATTKDRFLAGEVARVDLLKADLQITLADDQYRQATAAEAVARQTLFGLLYLDPESQVQLTALSEMQAQSSPTEEVPSVDQAAVSVRPELESIEAKKKATEAELEAAKDELKPRLTYSLRNGLLTNSFVGDQLTGHLGIEGQLAISFPIFDGGTSKAKQEQARLKLQQLEMDRHITEQRVTTERQNALAQLTSSQERVRLLAGELGTARENLSISQARYQAGEAPIIEVIDAQNSLTNLTQAHFQAVYDHLSANIAYQRALGERLPTDEHP